MNMLVQMQQKGVTPFYSNAGLVVVVVVAVIIALLVGFWHWKSQTGVMFLGLKCILAGALYGLFLCVYSPSLLWAMQIERLINAYDIMSNSVSLGTANEVSKSTSALLVNSLDSLPLPDLNSSQENYKEVRLITLGAVSRYVLILHFPMKDDFGEGESGSTDSSDNDLESNESPLLNGVERLKTQVE